MPDPARRRDDDAHPGDPEPGSAGRQFVLLSVGELALGISEATRDVLADLQTHDPIATLILDAKQGAFAPEAGTVLGSRRQGAGRARQLCPPLV